jgi:hypothetical protein
MKKIRNDRTCATRQKNARIILNLTNATAIGFAATVKIRLGSAAVTVIEGQVAFTNVSDKTKEETSSRWMEKKRE